MTTPIASGSSPVVLPLAELPEHAVHREGWRQVRQLISGMDLRASFPRA